MDIDKAFEKFMEFPEGSDQKTVTTVSCKLFAKWYSEQLQKHIDDIVKKTLDEDALTAAYLYGFSDSRKRIKELEQRVIDLQNHDDLSYIDKKLGEQEGE